MRKEGSLMFGNESADKKGWKAGHEIEIYGHH